ncbi:MAG: phosphate/phosphite/phosphonate ABC transporter substrate-binding protein [Candidatus Schekmanbacteria bacterium]|nr:phosphate/phosphite/phosphonate ABC transporter substrate-binding protein [Candidatus Schekmanbacteria bacterium]
MFKRLKMVGSIILALILAATGCEQMKNQAQQEQPAKVEEPKPTKGILKVGYLICNSKEETIERFAASAVYIGQKLGYKIHMYPMNTYEADEDVKKFGIQVFKVNSLVYIQMKHDMDIQMIAGEKRGPKGRFTSGTVVVRKGSPIKTLKDLKGKKFAFGPQFAPFGFLVQYDLMLKAGFNPDDVKSGMYYAIPWGANKHEKAIYNVQAGAYDAGAAPMLDLIHLAETGKIKYGDQYTPEEQDFEIIAESEPAPYCTFAATKETDADLVNQVKKALLGLTKNDLAKMDPEWLVVEGFEWDKGGYLRSGEVLNITKAAMIDGYEEALDTDYDVLRNMAKNVGMAPYDAEEAPGKPAEVKK